MFYCIYIPHPVLEFWSGRSTFNNCIHNTLNKCIVTFESIAIMAALEGARDALIKDSAGN